MGGRIVRVSVGGTDEESEEPEAGVAVLYAVSFNAIVS